MPISLGSLIRSHVSLGTTLLESNRAPGLSVAALNREE